jgi:hypothetical protein
MTQVFNALSQIFVSLETVNKPEYDNEKVIWFPVTAIHKYQKITFPSQMPHEHLWMSLPT